MKDIEQKIVNIIENNSPELAATEILALFDVVGQSEQLVLFAEWLQYNGKWSTTEQQVKDFLKEQQEQK